MKCSQRRTQTHCFSKASIGHGFALPFDVKPFLPCFAFNICISTSVSCHRWTIPAQLLFSTLVIQIIFIELISIWQKTESFECKCYMPHIPANCMTETNTLSIFPEESPKQVQWLPFLNYIQQSNIGVIWILLISSLVRSFSCLQPGLNGALLCNIILQL